MDRAALEQWLAVGSELNGLAIAPAWREGVLTNLERLATMSDLLEGFALAEDVELAPRYDAKPGEGR